MSFSNKVTKIYFVDFYWILYFRCLKWLTCLVHLMTTSRSQPWLRWGSRWRCTPSAWPRTLSTRQWLWPRTWPAENWCVSFCPNVEWNTEIPRKQHLQYFALPLIELINSHTEAVFCVLVTMKYYSNSVIIIKILM